MSADPELIATLADVVVGRVPEIEQVVAAIRTGRHLLLEGPPGTGKSTLVRELAHHSDIGFEFVEGNAELTPARLIGSFDPAAVINSGYTAECFVDGPLLRAMRSGSMLFVEEINRIPQETLNVLITSMSEREITVPRLETVQADNEFRFVAAMNPFDAIGTARISAAIYDRVCRLLMGYQSKEHEMQIVATETGVTTSSALVMAAVDLVRATRTHNDLRTGSSVRGAIDIVTLCSELGSLRGVSIMSPAVTKDACQLAVSGRIVPIDTFSRDATEIVEELWRQCFATTNDDHRSAHHSSSSGDLPKGDPRKRGAR